MGEFVEFRNKVTITIDEEYFRNQDSVQEDELVVIVINYLRRIGKYSYFLGFDAMNRHVLLINEEKYCIIDWGNERSGYSSITLKKSDRRVGENRLKERANGILEKFIN